MKRVLALTLSLLLLCSCAIQAIPAVAALRPALAETGELTDGSLIDLSEAQHFIVRHWHSRENTEGSSFQGGSPDSSGNRYFVVVEGYIVPVDPSDSFDTTDPNRNFEFYLVYQSDVDEEHKKGQLELILNRDYVKDSFYVDELDHENGVIAFSTNAQKKGNGDDAEEFTSYSISAGHDAAKATGEELTITYDPNIRLVKAHAFYTKTTVDTENGTQDDTVFGNNGIAMSDEQDTAMVYTFISDTTIGGVEYKKGEIVKVDANGNLSKTGTPLAKFKLNKNGAREISPEERNGQKGFAVADEDALRALGLSGKVEVSKAYDTSLGLHTDKTATVHTALGAFLKQDENGNPIPDGRTFDLDLEVWRSEGLAPQIGMVLDASGSMAFASDTPTAIRVKEGTQAYSALSGKFGAYTDGFGKDDFMDGLVGYYEVLNNNGSEKYANYRNWYLNSVDHKTTTDYGKLLSYANYEDFFGKLVYQGTINSFDFSNQMTMITWEGTEYTGWGAGPNNFSQTYGFNLTFNGFEGKNSGFLLESVDALTDDNFTLSFTLKQAKAGPPKLNGDVEVLYIGPEKSGASGNYFHVVRRENDLVASYGAGGSETALFTLPTQFANGVQRVITFVFKDDGGVAAYMDGALQTAASVPGLSHDAIVFAPFQDNNDGPSSDAYFYVDNMSLFKRTLNDKQVDAMAALHTGTNLNSGVTVDQMRKVKMSEEEQFLTPQELALLLDPHNTDTSLLGWAGYSYFVYDPNTSNMAYNPLAYYNKGANGAGFVITSDNRVDGEGWYYVSSTSNQTNITNNRTAKQLLGLSTSLTFKDTIAWGEASLSDTQGKGGAAPSKSAFDVPPTSDANTGFTYKGSGGPIKFYIDSDGYLRCFFSSKNENSMTSYVYELEDGEYIRTEALQRALGLFVTELDERSPSARVSAVRFSAGANTFSANQLVLLDWTDDPVISTGMLSLQWGDGSFNGRTTSNRNNYNLDQYNYFLTGNTDTASGLNAYITHLQTNGRDNPYSADDGIPPKYLILFTDGMNTGNEKEAQEHAKTLKKADYVIYTVLLDGGSMDEETYEKAKKFLTSLAGTKDSTSGEDYFYSTKKAREEDTNHKYDNVGDADILTQVFVDQILNHITKPLENYEVQDYIDPRFDLVDADGTVWHLKAGGKVEKSNGGTITVTDTSQDTITLCDHSDDSAQTPYLRYSKEKDLYYLLWVDQTIPGCAIGANRLPVWNARVTVRAKDDFIGGNAILTNGNNKEMNWVYNPGDADRSSGTGDAKRTEAEISNGNYPSKGFPRTSVNVTPPEENVELDQTIFMGEALDGKNIAHMIIEAAKADSTKNEAHYYWEYIGRFVEYINNLAKTREGIEIIDHLHSINRSGEDISDIPDDSLKEGKMKIISNRMYDLIFGTNQYGKNPDHKTLSIETLSELLLDDETVIDREDGEDKDGENKTGSVNNSQYLYIPYIYLPDDLKNPSNSTGRGKGISIDEEYRWDVIGYLYFHIEENEFKDAEGNTETYPSYPKGGIATDTRTRKSQLTVKFLAHSANQRGDWNNSQAIQDKGANENVIYGRDTTNKPAPGTQIEEDVVIRGTFETKIVSGDLALEVELTKAAVEELKKRNETVLYCADVYWNDTRYLGTFQAELDPAKLTAGTNTVYATITYIDYEEWRMGVPKTDSDQEGEKKDGAEGVAAGDGEEEPGDKKGLSAIRYEMDEYGLPYGTYTLKNGRTMGKKDGVDDLRAAEGFVIGEIELIPDDGNGDYSAPNPFPTRATAPTEKKPSTDRPNRGTDPAHAWEHIASSEGNNFFLSNKLTSTAQPGPGRKYTDYRFGVYKVRIDYPTGELEIVKKVVFKPDDVDSALLAAGQAAAKEMDYTFTITGPDYVGGRTFDVKQGEQKIGEAEFSKVTPKDAITGGIVPYALTSDDEGSDEDESDEETPGEETPGEETPAVPTATVTITDVTVTGKEGSKSVKIVGLPEGSYTVTEVRDANGNPINVDGFSVETTIDQETVEVKSADPNDPNSTGSVKVTVTNTYTARNGDLVITKALGDDAPDEAKTKEYTFTITGPNTVAEKSFNVEGAKESSIAFSNDTPPIATVTVIGPGDVKIKGLPVGTYNVTEKRDGTEITGYELTVTGEGDVQVVYDTGIIAPGAPDDSDNSDGSDDSDDSEETDKPGADNSGYPATITITNTYTAKPGHLIIEKIVKGENGSDDIPEGALTEEFTFTVTGPAAVAGKTYTVTVLTGGENTGDNTGGSGDNTENGTDNGTGDGTDGGAGDSMGIRAIADDDDPEGDGDGNGGNAGDNNGDATKQITFSSGDAPTAVVIVPGNGSVKIEGLPAGTYKVVENTPKGYDGYDLTTTYYLDGDESETYNPGGDPGTFGIKAGDSKRVTAVNTYARQRGSLTVTKVLPDGSPEEARTKTYTFTITGPEDADGTYVLKDGTAEAKTIKFENGTATVTITGAGSVTIEGLPTGKYTLVEDTDGAKIDGYTLTVSYDPATEDTESTEETEETEDVEDTEDTEKSDDGASGTATVKKGETPEITVTNTYAAQAGDLTIIKKLGQGAPEEAEEKAYTFIITTQVEAVKGQTYYLGDDAKTPVRFSETSPYTAQVEITGEGSVTIKGLPEGDYVVREDEEKAGIDGYDWSIDLEDSKASAKVEPGKTASVTATNTYTQWGSLTLQKTVVGEEGVVPDEAENTPYKFTVKGPDEVKGKTVKLSGVNGETSVTFSDTIPPVAEVQITGPNRVTFVGLPKGTYTVVEEIGAAEIEGYTVEVTYDPEGEDENGTATVENKAGATVEIINTYAAQPGDLTIIKKIEGDPTYGVPDSAASATYAFSIATDLAAVKGQEYAVEGAETKITFSDGDAEGNPPYTATVTVTGEGSVTIKGLPAGEYTVTEADATIDGYDWNVSVSNNGVAEVKKGATGLRAANVTVTNSYAMQTGTLVLTKKIDGDAPDSVTEKKEYTFTIQGPAAVKGKTVDGVTFDDDGKATVTIEGAHGWTIKGLPVGVYTITEDTGAAAIDGYTLTVAYDPEDGKATVVKDDTVHVEVTNSYAMDTGTLMLTKKIDGDAPASVTEKKEYKFTVEGPAAVKGKTVDGVTFDDDGKATVKIEGAHGWTIKGLPVGVYTITEDTGAAVIDGYTLSVAYDPEDGKASVQRGETANVTVINTYKKQGSLTLKKTVAGDADKEVTDGLEYTFEITGPVELAGRTYDLGGNEKAEFRANADLKTASATAKVTGPKSMTFDGLPAGTYTIKEIGAPELDGYTLTVSAEVVESGDANGKRFVDGKEVEVRISNEGHADVEIINTYASDPGSLTIRKEFGGVPPTGADTKVYSFTISTDLLAARGKTYSLEDGSASVTFSDGEAPYTAEVTITGENKVTIVGLPAGAYTVTETDAAIDGYDWVAVPRSADATVPMKGNATVSIKNTYTALPGDLTIKKALGENSPETATSKDYTFTITTGLTAVAGKTYDLAEGGSITFSAGDGPLYTATVKVKGEQSVTIKRLPAGEYTVTEDAESARIDNYNLTIDPSGGATATVVQGKTGYEAMVVAVMNTYTRQQGDLTVTKVLANGSPAAANSIEYTFTITGPAQVNGKTYELTRNGVTAGSVTFKGDADGKAPYTASVTVQGAGSVTIKGLPTGTYGVTEDRDKAKIGGYTLQVSGENDAVSVTESGNAQVEVTNTYTLLPDLMLTKAFGSDVVPPGAETRVFSFRLTGPAEAAGKSYAVSGATDDTQITFSTGNQPTATVTVKGAGSVTIAKLPGGTYSAEEDKTSAVFPGYKLDVDDGGSATLSPGVGGEITVTNTYTLNPATVEIVCAKELVGRTLISGEFSFELSVESADPKDGIVLPDPAVATNAADGEVRFGALTFTKPGAYTVTVSERIPEPREEGMDYDRSVFHIVYTVTAGADGNLSVEAELPDGDIVFVNELVKQPDMPQTVDRSHVEVFVALALLSFTTLVGIALYVYVSGKNRWE